MFGSCHLDCQRQLLSYTLPLLLLAQLQYMPQTGSLMFPDPISQHRAHELLLFVCYAKGKGQTKKIQPQDCHICQIATRSLTPASLPWCQLTQKAEGCSCMHLIPRFHHNCKDLQQFFSREAEKCKNLSLLLLLMFLLS